MAGVVWVTDKRVIPPLDDTATPTTVDDRCSRIGCHAPAAGRWETHDGETYGFDPRCIPHKDEPYGLTSEL